MILFKQKVKSSFRYLIIILLPIFISSTPLTQKVLIQFENITGAKYYELLFMSDSDNKDSYIEKVTKSPFEKNIDPKYKRVQIRAVFNEVTKTKWSQINSLVTILTDPVKKVQVVPEEEVIDHSKLLDTEELIYKITLIIRPPFLYEAGYLVLGPETTIDFSSTSHVYIPDRIIYYRFRDIDKEDSKFIKFKRPFKIKKLFANTAQEYYLEYYSITNHKYKEKIQSKKVFIDTEAPKVNFITNNLNYTWQIDHHSNDIKLRIYLDGILLNNIGIFDNQFSIPISLSLFTDTNINKQSLNKDVKIELYDASGNKETWREKLEFKE